MANAVGQSEAVRILIPLNKCDTLIAGVNNTSTSYLMENAIEKIKNLDRK